MRWQLSRGQTHQALTKTLKLVHLLLDPRLCSGAAPVPQRGRPAASSGSLKFRRIAVAMIATRRRREGTPAAWAVS